MESIQYTLNAIHNHIIFFSGKKYANLKGYYGYVTGALIENNKIILGVIINNNWITIKESISNAKEFLTKEIELCDDSDFKNEIQKFTEINTLIKEKLKL